MRYHDRLDVIQFAFLEIITRLIIKMINDIEIGATLGHGLLLMLAREAHSLIEELFFFFLLSFIQLLLNG